MSIIGEHQSRALVACQDQVPGWVMAFYSNMTVWVGVFAWNWATGLLNASISAAAGFAVAVDGLHNLCLLSKNGSTRDVDRNCGGTKDSTSLPMLRPDQINSLSKPLQVARSKLL